MIYEIKDNSPIENPFSYTHKIYIEEIAASDKISGRMLYKINLGFFFIIKIFFKNGNEYKMAIDGDRIMIGNSLVKNRLNGNYINVAINSDGSLNKNILMPYELLEFLSNN